VLSSVGLVINVVATVAAAAAAFALWVASRKRIAADTIGRAEEQAARLVKDAERDADTGRKEALLDAKEKAHEILVEAERQESVSDEEAVWLSRDIARRIENELEYPGQIKVTVVRETRAVDYAK
jgi:HD superfamily phosphodiesterase